MISNGFHELELKNQRTVPAAVADTPSMEVESSRKGSDLFIRSTGQLHTANGGVFFCTDSFGPGCRVVGMTKGFLRLSEIQG